MCSIFFFPLSEELLYGEWDWRADGLWHKQWTEWWHVRLKQLSYMSQWLQYEVKNMAWLGRNAGGQDMTRVDTNHLFVLLVVSQKLWSKKWTKRKRRKRSSWIFVSFCYQFQISLEDKKMYSWTMRLPEETPKINWMDRNPLTLTFMHLFTLFQWIIRGLLPRSLRSPVSH